MTTAHIKAVTLGVTLASLAGFSTPALHAADEAEVKYQPITLSADVGTLGYGLSASWRFADHFGVRGGFNYLSHSEDTKTIEGISYSSADLTLLSEPVALDFYPWATKSWRISIGVLINQNELEGVVPQSSTAGIFQPIGSGSYQTSDTSLSLTVEQSPVSPYLSIGGSFYLDKAKRWAINGEIGVAYTGSPEATLISSTPGVINPVFIAEEEQQIEDWAEKYQFYPIVKVGMSFSF